MTLSPQELESRILYKDQLMLVLDKPPGIPVHAGPKGGPSLEDGFADLKFGYKETPRLAHRLDRDTSGCLVLGRNDRGIKKLGKLFESGQVKKTYWAIVEGRPPEDEGTIDLPLKKVKLAKGWSMRPAKKNEDGAQEAVTDYKVVKRLRNDRTWLELSPRTGRTHQIRVHLAALGCPILGDWLYGGGDERPAQGEFPLLHLHARSVTVPLHHDKEPVTVSAELPMHMVELID
ncbi:MAG: RNA pseudouridine synthase [Alphaproteobacteria bacterium]|nr:RNA pseudouridine synthase [Alphaproteobacteria bacterium]